MKLGWVMLVVVIGSCGAPAKSGDAGYPKESCGASCGRVTTLGVLHDKVRSAESGMSSDTFLMVDLEKRDPHGSQYAYWISCSACPFEVGKRYRARLHNTPEETLHSIMLLGTELFENFQEPPRRRDRLYFMNNLRRVCEEPGSSWKVVEDGVVECTPGAPPAITWTDPDPVVDVPGCSQGYPTGIGNFNWGPGDDGAVKLLIGLDDWYEYEDPAAFNQALLASLIAKGPPGSYSNRVFALADGPPTLFLDVSIDLEGQYYGMRIAVRGAPDATGFREGGGQAVPLFELLLEPTYSTDDKLISDAAAGLYERLWWGWTCEAGGAKPRRTLAEICAEADPAYGTCVL